MGSAVDRVDVVGEGELRDGVRVVPLERNLDGDIVALGFHVDRLFVQDLLALVEQLDELGDAAGVLEALRLGLAGLGIGGAFVGEGDLDALVEEGELAQTIRERVVVVLVHGEDGLIGKEMNLGALARGGAHLAQLRDGVAFGVVHLPRKPIAPDLDVELFRERVDAGDADTVETARDLVVRGVELSARMQNRQHHLHRRHRHAVDRFVIHRNAAPVIHHRDRVVHMDRHIDPRRIPRQRLVHTVVHHLVHQVVQPLLPRRPDIHRRPLPHRRQPLQNRNVLGRVPTRLRHALSFRCQVQHLVRRQGSRSHSLSRVTVIGSSETGRLRSAPTPANPAKYSDPPRVSRNLSIPFGTSSPVANLPSASTSTRDHCRANRPPVQPSIAVDLKPASKTFPPASQPIQE